MNSDSTDDNRAMVIELPNHRQKLVVVNNLVKFSRPAFFGNNEDELRVPNGLNAAEITNRMGKIAKHKAMIPTMCRQPTWRNQPPLALPSFTTGGVPVPWGVYSNSAVVTESSLIS